MAELAASFVGLGALGAHTLKASIELKHLWSSIKAAPADVKSLIDELTYLQTLLATLKQQHDAFAPFALPTPIWDDCCQHCASVAAELEQIAHELKIKIQRWRLGGSVKVLFKEDVIAKHTARLAAAKTNLLLAQTAFNRNNSNPTEKLVANGIGSSIQLYQLAQSLRQTALLESPGTQEIAAGTARATNAESEHTATIPSGNNMQVAGREKRTQKPTYEYSLRSRWLGKLFQLQITISCNTWGLNLVQYNIIPHDAPIWKLLESDDLAGLQNLFMSGEASIYDVNAHNLSVLDYAASNSNHEVVQFLLDAGCSITESTLYSFYRFYWFDKFGGIWQPLKPGPARWNSFAEQGVKMGRVLMSQSDHLLIEDPAKFALGRYIDAANVPENLRLLLSHAFPPYRQRSISERVSNLFTFGLHDPELYPLWLGQDNIDEDCLSKETRGRRISLLGDLARVCGLHWRSSGIQTWSSLLEQTVESGGIDVSYSCGESLLFGFLKEWLWHCDRPRCSPRSISSDLIGLDRAAHRWLETLTKAGADLTQLAQAEHDVLMAKKHPSFSSWNQRYPENPVVRVTGLTSGPSLDDWHVYVSNPLDEWSCDFWYLVEEGPEITMPGTWIDEDEERAMRRRAAPGSFKTLATSRRKRRRYLRMMSMTDLQARETLGGEWDDMLTINKEFGGPAKIKVGVVYRSSSWPRLEDPLGGETGINVIEWDDGDVLADDVVWIQLFHSEYCQGKKEQGKCVGRWRS